MFVSIPLLQTQYAGTVIITVILTVRHGGYFSAGDSLGVLYAMYATVTIVNTTDRITNIKKRR